MPDQARNALATLLDAERMLAEAKTLEDVKSIRDKAEAARTYAKAAQLGLEIQNRAAEVKLKAEREAGRFLAKLSLHGGNHRSKTQHEALKLEDIGITKIQSSRWQKQAAVPEKLFYEYLKTACEIGKEVTAAGLLRMAKTSFPKKNGAKNGKKTTSILTVVSPDSEIPTPLELVKEMEDHRLLLENLLRPYCSNRAKNLLPEEKRYVLRLLGEMKEQLEAIRKVSRQSKTS